MHAAPCCSSPQPASQTDSQTAPTASKPCSPNTQHVHGRGPAQSLNPKARHTAPTCTARQPQALTKTQRTRAAPTACMLHRAAAALSQPASQPASQHPASQPARHAKRGQRPPRRRTELCSVRCVLPNFVWSYRCQLAVVHLAIGDLVHC